MVMLSAVLEKACILVMGFTKRQMAIEDIGQEETDENSALINNS